MLSSIAVLKHDIKDFHVFKNEAVRAIRSVDGRISPQRHLTHDRGDNRGVVDLLVEHRAVGTIVHGIEEYFKLNRLGSGAKGFDDGGYKGDIVNVMIFVPEAEICQGGGGGVGDRGGDV